MVGLVRSLDIGQFMAILTHVCLASALMSLALRFVSPAAAFTVGVDTTDFNGTFSSKNVLGQVMAAGALACLYGLRTEPRRRAVRFAMLAVFFGMALAAKSTAALLVTVMFTLLSLYFAMRKKGGSARQIANIAAVAVTPVFLVAVLVPDAALEMIGKDPTLTGRTEIWGYVCDYIAMKPLLGWGYYGFWNMQNPAAIAISAAVHWSVPESHNGMLELLLTTGFLGTGFALVLFGRNLVLGFGCLGGPHREAGIAMIMCCAGLLMEGVSEMVLLSPTSALSGIFFAAGMFCEQALRERRGFRAVKRRQAVRSAPSANLPVYQRG
jgi:O-antigen ligase